MRISDWSSDVCSSDLRDLREQLVADRVAQRVVDRLEAVEVEDHQRAARLRLDRMAERAAEILGEVEPVGQAGEIVEARHAGDLQIGRASGRERVCQCVYISVVAVSQKKKKRTT